MAKVLTESKISSRADRKRLAIRSQPYWRGIDPEVHLGYRKGKRGGVWLVRWRSGEGYRQHKLGTADDEIREGTLDYDAAVKVARQVVEEERQQERATADGPLLTVRSVVETYIEMRDARDSARQGREVRSDARIRLERYVIGRPARGKRNSIDATALAEIPLHALTEDDLAIWRAALPERLKWTTKQRLINDVKAALNEAYATNRSRLPATFPSVLTFGLREKGHADTPRDSVARDNLILSDAQVASLICAAHKIDEDNGWEGDLHRLVVVLAATGARFSQIAKMRVGDVQVEAGRLLIPPSEKGRGGRKTSTPVPVGQDVLEVLKPVILGRPATAILLERWRSKQVSGSIRWQRVDRGPWKTSSQILRSWNEIKTEAGLPEAIPYSLRHSSIVRGIRANLPIHLVAAIHDTSVAMIERHYGRYIADGLDELAARAVVPLVSSEAMDEVPEQAAA